MSESNGSSSSDVIAGLTALLDAHRRGPAHLTRHGLARVRRLLGDAPADGQLMWNRRCRRLWLEGRLIREFARLAPAQMAVLDALQAVGWPVDGVPNPFRGPRSTAVRKLHCTVVNLNRPLRGGTVRFREDGVRVWCEVGQCAYP
jgi:hypothetical protein